MDYLGISEDQDHEDGGNIEAKGRMEQAGWIAASWRITENNRRARIYHLTRTGQKRLSEEEARRDRLLEAVGKVLRFVYARRICHGLASPFPQHHFALKS